MTLRSARVVAALALAAWCGCGDPDKPAPQAGMSAAPSGHARGGPSGRAALASSNSAKPGTSTTPSASPPTAGAPLAVKSVVKVEQLLGDLDKHLGKPTNGMTMKRFGVDGADLGYPFEGADGRLIFLFGDTIGTDGQAGSDSIGYTTLTDPEKGVALDFYTRPDGPSSPAGGPGAPRRFLPFRPVNKQGKQERLQGFEVPIGGIRVASGTYVAYKTNHAGDEDGSKDGESDGDPTDITYLASFDEKTGDAKELCAFSRQPAGKFQKISWHPIDLDVDASPDPTVKSHDWILMYGSGRHRASHVYLALVPVSGLPTCSGFRYFTGLSGSKPTWSEKESDAKPVFEDPEQAVGEMSVTWAAPTKRWLALYDNKQGHRVIVARDAEKPWGPWTPPVVVFDAQKSGNGIFIHDPKQKPPDKLAGPMIGKNKDNPESAHGATYAPFVVERWTKPGATEKEELVVYFTLSVWNPYVVELMKATFARR